jgi:hypothetical protein
MFESIYNFFFGDNNRVNDDEINKAKMASPNSSILNKLPKEYQEEYTRLLKEQIKKNR